MLKKQIDIFTINNNVYRSIQCKMLSAIKMSEWFPDRAMLIYEKIMIVSHQHNFSNNYKMSKYNMALLLKKLNYLQKAELEFLQLLELCSNDSEFTFNVYIEYIDLLLILSKKEEAAKYYLKLKEIKVSIRKYEFYIKYYDLKLQKNDLLSKINAYKQYFIPYSSKIKNKTLEKSN